MDFISSFLEMWWKTPQEAFLTNILGGSKSSQTDTTEKVKRHKYPFVVVAFVSYHMILNY